MIKTTDMHTGGEPLRVITDGLPIMKGETVLDKRRYFERHYDHIRTGLIWEPRGHADMYGAVITPSTSADFDVFFLHNEGYSTMCGHAIIALTKLIVQKRIRTNERDRTHVTINVPAGQVYAEAVVRGDEVKEVSFRNVPSFVYARGQHVQVSGIGRVRFDVAYGGAFYAIVEAQPLGLALTTDDYARLIDYGRRIKRAIMREIQLTHPFEEDLGFLYGTIFTGPPQQSDAHSRNVCIFADGEVDRSATGSGVSARAALHYFSGELSVNQRVTIESIIGTTMTVRVTALARFGPHEAVIPEVSGNAYVTGRSEFWFDPKDPLNRGFLLR